MILFISCPAGEDKCQDWAVAAAAAPIPRQCPNCEKPSIRGHGWRSKQAHDADHDWIRIHRGYCKSCHLSFTFLPVLSLPYTHYSTAARGEAMRRRFVEHHVWEQSAPELQSDRCPDVTTLRRWCRCLDTAPDFPHLRSVLEMLPRQWAHAVQLWQGTWQLSWTTFAACLRYYWPLRL